MGSIRTVLDSVGWIETILSAWLLLLAVLYAWGARRRVGRAPVANLLFAMAMAGALGALHVPLPFRSLSTRLVEGTGLPALLRDADARIDAIESLPGDIVDTLRGPFAEGDEEIEADPSPAEGRVLAARVIPAIEATITRALRGACFALCLLALLVAFAMRRSELLVSELRELRRRVAALEREETGSPSG